MSDFKKAITNVTNAQIIDLKKSKARLEQEVASIRDRVRDIKRLKARQHELGKHEIWRIAFVLF